MVTLRRAETGRTYNEAVDAFAPYDRIREPSPEVRADLLWLLDIAVTGD